MSKQYIPGSYFLVNSQKVVYLHFNMDLTCHYEKSGIYFARHDNYTMLLQISFITLFYICI